MTTAPTSTDIGFASTVDRLARARPDVVLVAPYMSYLLLMTLVGFLPPTLQPVAVAVRGVGSLAVVWLFRHHLPPWGRPYWLIAIVGGIIVGWGWVAGQYYFDSLGWPTYFPFYPGSGSSETVRDVLGANDLFWTTYWLRLIVACTAVPVVEELFWRGFLLRAMIDWQRFDRIPLGKFTWFSFLGTSLISVFQHPANWEVSILCWMVFNAVFYWTRSLYCLVLLHGITNLVLYMIVWRNSDWIFI